MIHPAKAAIVTGAASGVGLATARILLHRGSVLGIDLADLPPTIPAGPQLRWVAGNVSVRGTWAATLGLAARQFGVTQGVLVLSAARLAVGTVLDTPLSTFREIFDANLYSAFLGLQACLPHMISRGAGAVAVIVSVNELQAGERLAAYNCTKSALIQLVRSAAVDHAARLHATVALFGSDRVLFGNDWPVSLGGSTRGLTSLLNVVASALGPSTTAERVGVLGANARRFYGLTKPASRRLAAVMPGLDDQGSTPHGRAPE